MMNRLDALKYFIVAAETLSFKNTAGRFSVLPQVITRMMSERESELGEPLFKRNTRLIRLTDFGVQFLPKAVAFLQEEERLFGMAFPNPEIQIWGIYLYRPYQTITPKRVLLVFDLLEKFLRSE